MNTLLPPLKPVAPQLARRMAPLSTLTLLVIGGVLPWLYEQSQQLKFRRDLTFVATAIQESVQRVVARDPELWAYQPQGLREALRPFKDLGIAVQCRTHLGVPCDPLQPLTSQPLTSRVPIDLKNDQNSKTPKIKLSIIHEDKPVGELFMTSLNSTDRSLLNIWWITSPLALFVALLIEALPWWAARVADRANQSLWSQLTELNQTLERRVRERTQDLSRMNDRLLTIQEEERQRMSRDLHDELGQTLTGLRLQIMHTQILNQDPELDPAFTQILEVIDLGVEQVRRIAYEQRPPELDMLGLYPALEALVRRAQDQAPIMITLTLPPSAPQDPLPNDLAVSLFRVAQEGITNALRHSSGDRVWIIIEEQRECLKLSVNDNGSLNTHPLMWGGGLSGAHGRLKRVGGDLEVIAEPQQGLSLIARVPWVESKSL